MFKLPSVSIIIVNYNGKRFIDKCLDSVLQSDYLDFEIIMVDNASTDGSGEFLQKKYSQNKKIKLFRSKVQLYFTGGSNFGAKHASGEKLIFLNSDTTVAANWIKRLVKFAQGQPKYLVQPKILKADSPNTIDNVGGRYTFGGLGFGLGQGETDKGQYDKNRRVDFINGTAFMINRKFFEQLGGFDKNFRFFYEDVDLCLRAKRAGGSCWCCPKSVVCHRGGLSFKGNIGNQKQSQISKINRLTTIRKNFTGGERIIRLIITKMINLLPLNLTFKFLIESLRWQELKSFVGKKKFSLLDLGCGDGFFLKIASARGVNATGADLRPADHPKIIVSSIEKLKLEKKFEVVTLFHVLEHTKNPEKILKKIRPLLKKNGFLVIEVPLVGNFTEKILQKDYFAYTDPAHRHFFTKKAITALLDQSGFAIKKKGFTLLEFPLMVLTTDFKKGLIFFLPLKLLSFLGLNDEIIRLYCTKK